MAIAPVIDQPLTSKDFFDLPDDETRFELIWGELYMSPSPSTVHQRAVRRLLETVNRYLTDTNTGEVFTAPLDVELDVHNVVEPDVVVVGFEHENIITDTRIVGVPDVCMEVLSPSNRTQDTIRKQVLYSRFGVPEYWIVDPEEETISVLVLDGDHFRPEKSDDGIARSVRFPGLEIDPTGIAQPPVRRSK